MTICACVKVRDGLVLGTDSMTQIWGQDPKGNRHPIKNYANARKLFQIGEWPIGVMTYGIGNIGPRSIHGFVRDFSESYTGDSRVESVSDALYEFIAGAYYDQFKDTPEAPLGFFIAGCSEGEPFSEEWEFQLPRDNEILQVRPLEAFGSSWRGVAIPFTRLYRGLDPRITADLIKAGVPSESIDKVAGQYVSPIAYDGMPVQDAINLVIYILKTTIGLATFELGTPSCGGPLQIATVLPEDGFQWLKKPALTVEL